MMEEYTTPQQIHERRILKDAIRVVASSIVTESVSKVLKDDKTREEIMKLFEETTKKACIKHAKEIQIESDKMRRVTETLE